MKVVSQRKPEILYICILIVGACDLVLNADLLSATQSKIVMMVGAFALLVARVFFRGADVAKGLDDDEKDET